MTELIGEFVKILGPPFEWHAVKIGKGTEVPLAPTGHHDAIDRLLDPQLAFYPIDMHQCRDADRQDGDAVIETDSLAQAFDDLR